MKKYSFEKIDNIFVLGDCHGEFKSFFHGIKEHLRIKDDDKETPHQKELEFRARIDARRNRHNEGPLRGHGLRFEVPPTIRWNSSAKMPSNGKSKKGFPYSNSIFIFAGDCGIGFNKPKYYTDLFEKFNKVLNYNNSFIIFVRGNHDDPSYFDGETINLSNIKAVPDYSVISAKGHNILCVGGAISIDRTWRKKQENRINRFSVNNKKKLYWDGEAPVFNEDALREIAENTVIDIVVSHSSPSFATPENHGFIDEWVDEDVNLKSDIKNERIVFDKIFNTLRELNSQPKYWAYGHFDIMYIEKRSDTVFRAINDSFNPVNVDKDIYEFSKNEEAGNMKKKLLKKATIKKQAIEELRNDWAEMVLRADDEPVIEAFRQEEEQENEGEAENNNDDFAYDLDAGVAEAIDDRNNDATIEIRNRGNLGIRYFTRFENNMGNGRITFDELRRNSANAAATITTIPQDLYGNAVATVATNNLYEAATRGI